MAEVGGLLPAGTMAAIVRSATTDQPARAGYTGAVADLVIIARPRALLRSGCGGQGRLPPRELPPEACAATMTERGSYLGAAVRSAAIAETDTPRRLAVSDLHPLWAILHVLGWPGGQRSGGWAVGDGRAR